MALQYRIALINVWWTDGGEDIRYFENESSQSEYFDILAEGNLSPLANFNMGDNIQTTITFLDKSGREPDEVVKSNYAVVYKYDGDTIIGRRYFFAKCYQDSSGQMLVELNLDDIQTNYFKHKKSIAKSRVIKSCFNRWKDRGDGIVEFNADVDSPLFERESIQNVSKRLTKRTHLNYEIDTTKESVLNKWLRDNIVGYQVYYLRDNEYKFNNTSGTEITITLNRIRYSCFGGFGLLEGVTPALIVPVYKTWRIGGNNRIRLYRENFTGRYIDLSMVGIENFRASNNNTSFQLTSKFTTNPIFNVQQYTYGNDYIIDANNNLCILGVGSSTTYGGTLLSGYETTNFEGVGIFNVPTDDSSLSIPLSNYKIDCKMVFNKSEIIGANKDVKFNPKLLGFDFRELKVTDERGEGYSYDIQKIGVEEVKPIYTEPQTPDITKIYCRLQDLKGIYIPETAQNLTGHVGSADMSLMSDNDQLSQMLANNKNFALQSQLRIGERMVGGLIGGGLSGITGGAVGGAIFGGITGIIENQLTIDNMRNAPKDITNASGSAYFNVAYTEPGPVIEEYDILPHEKEIANDEMVQNGMTYGRMGYVSDFDNVRKHFNYIRADIKAITAPISNTEKDRLALKLQSGIRFWNQDIIDYEKENYERWLEDGKV